MQFWSICEHAFNDAAQQTWFQQGMGRARTLIHLTSQEPYPESTSMSASMGSVMDRNLVNEREVIGTLLEVGGGHCWEAGHRFSARL